MGEGCTTVVLQGAKHRIGIDLIAWAIQETTGVVVADVIPVRVNHTAAVKDIGTRLASF
jgi:hypothetical protein